MQPGKPATHTHGYIRLGTSTLFVALEIATGHVTAACKPRHRRQDRCHPFVWRKTSTEILKKVNRPTTLKTGY